MMSTINDIPVSKHTYYNPVQNLKKFSKIMEEEEEEYLKKIKNWRWWNFERRFKMTWRWWNSEEDQEVKSHSYLVGFKEESFNVQPT